MKNGIKISIAGNVMPLAYELLKNKGYAILKRDCNSLLAKKDNNEFIAEDMVQLLGLIAIYNEKGEKWEVSDSLIEEFLKYFR
ncbi:MAG: hypothetical protein JW925_12850 [Syntrophaceae bacterium]|nr:hypothetical protein [Syntrophaceae bacterium]